MRFFAFALCFVGAIAGCSSGDDVYVEKPARTSSALCTITPGEDICSRYWEGVAPAERDKTIAVLELATTFAAVAEDNLRTIATACAKTLLDLGVVAQPASTDPEATCSAATKALSSALANQGRHFSIAIRREPSCRARAAPSCARFGTNVRTECTAADVDVTYDSSMNDDEKLLSAIVQRNAGVMAQAKINLQTLASLAASITENVGTVAKMNPPSCAVVTTNLVTTTTASVTLATRLTADLMNAMDTNL